MPPTTPPPPVFRKHRRHGNTSEMPREVSQGSLRGARPLCTRRIRIFGEHCVVASRTDTSPLVWRTCSLPHTTLQTPAQTNSHPGPHLTPSRISSFPSNFCFVCSPINLMDGQVGNKTLLFLSVLFFDIFPMNTFPTLVWTVFMENSNHVFTGGKLPARAHASRGEKPSLPNASQHGAEPPHLRPPASLPVTWGPEPE